MTRQRYVVDVADLMTPKQAHDLEAFASGSTYSGMQMVCYVCRRMEQYCTCQSAPGPRRRPLVVAGLAFAVVLALLVALAVLLAGWLM